MRLQSTITDGQVIIEVIYSDYIADMCNESNLKCRTVLAPTIYVVDEVNDYMTAMNSNECKTYVSSNKCLFKGGSNEIQAMHTPEFLATIKCLRVPNHELKLKIGCPVMLIRNIDHSSGLCNGTKLIITRLVDKVIEAKLLNSNDSVNKVFIPIMTLTPSDAKLLLDSNGDNFPFCYLTQ
ncbi:uncharacterized protein LOC107482136 [Arachis duranensis]|uniref:Uncharacterized protein LOC107482136 n=1 Tax=Arachis duranensis TaxID=130453 RepID=A0A6P4CX98_ARADU|nr:uncharacterized protein LOC107482136 [Arachis duranensis]